jgi:hypothetical protein
MTTRDGFPDVRAMVEEILRSNPGASAEEINRQLARRMNAYNAAAQADLGGLSPDRMHQLLFGDWIGSGALRLNDRLSLDELADAALFADARTLLDYVATEGPVKETAARNLPRAAVAALLPRLRAPRSWQASYTDEGMRVRNEQDVLWLWPLRHCLLFASLLVRRKGLRISRRGRELLEDDRAGELYALLFHTLFRTLNLTLLSRDDRHAGLQSTVAYTFYKLRSEAREWTSSEALAESAWLESAKDPRMEWEAWSDADHRHYTLRHRVLDPLVEFGLLDDRTVPTGDRLMEKVEFRVTPLFDRFLRFRFEGEAGRDLFLMR